VRYVLLDRIRNYIHDAFDVNAEPAVAERRMTARKPVHLRATVYPIDTFCNIHIKDISATGAMGKTSAKLVAEQTVFVTVDDKLYHAGVVKWTDGREFGFSLPRASQIFGGHSESMDHGAREGHHSRATRTKISATGRLVTGRLHHRAFIHNISNGGMLLEAKSAIQPGQILIVQVGHAMPTYGRAQWCSDGKIGFMAEHPISVAKMLCELD
jgi:hypothetical protein